MTEFNFARLYPAMQAPIRFLQVCKNNRGIEPVAKAIGQKDSLMKIANMKSNIEKGSFLKTEERRPRLCFAFFLMLSSPILHLASATAAVKPTQSAEELAKEGIELRRAGRDSEALPKFQEAYGLLHSPRLAAQYGLCLQALSRWAEADTFLAEAISATKDPWIQKNRVQLKEASEIAKSHIGRVEILGSPDGAVVTVNGRTVGALPLAEAVKVNEGSVDIEVSAPGLATTTRTITVGGASYQSVVIRLKAAPASVPAVSASEANSKSDMVVTSGPQPAEPAFYSKPWFWGTVAGVVVVAGVTALLLSSSTEYPKVDQQGGWKP